MAEEDPVERESERSTMKVTREPTFQRVNADNLFPVFMGRDLEMAVLIATPRLVEITDGDTSELHFDGEMIEACRIRMSPGTAANAAFNILGLLVQAGRLDLSTIEANISQMREAVAPPEDRSNAN